MIINLSPVVAMHVGFMALRIEKRGDVLTINDADYDLSVIPDGATLPNAAEATGCKYITGDIERITGELHLTLLMPVSDRPTPAQAFPEPMHITDDGPIHLPADDPDLDGKTAQQIAQEYADAH